MAAITTLRCAVAELLARPIRGALRISRGDIAADAKLTVDDHLLGSSWTASRAASRCSATSADLRRFRPRHRRRGTHAELDGEFRYVALDRR